MSKKVLKYVNSDVPGDYTFVSSGSELYKAIEEKLSRETIRAIYAMSEKVFRDTYPEEFRKTYYGG